MEDAFEFNYKLFEAKFKDLSEDKRDQLRDAYYELWDQHFGDKAPTFPVMDTLVAFAKK